MIVPGLCLDAKVAILRGEWSVKDRYRIALYDELADLSPATTEYTNEREVVAQGYERGGRQITGWTVERDKQAAWITFPEVVWRDSYINARGGLIYNDSKPGLPAVAVLDFGRTIVASNGPFRVRLPDDKLLTLA